MPIPPFAKKKEKKRFSIPSRVWKQLKYLCGMLIIICFKWNIQHKAHTISIKLSMSIHKFKSIFKRIKYFQYLNFLFCTNYGRFLVPSSTKILYNLFNVRWSLFYAIKIYCPQFIIFFRIIIVVICSSCFLVKNRKKKKKIV